ncbi:MAG: hypothetical protein NTZ95_03475, partial [Candidatus Omnitrophica bacterium]|nr:hypothetical protein [Candidatus Omnitrophota bacterium]
MLRKTISALIIPSIILTSIPDAQSLSVWTQAENPAQRRSFLQKTLESTRLEYAIGDTQKAILASKGNDVTFLSGGRILAGEALKNDSLKLLGAIINSEVRIVLEARASADPEAYGRIRDHILKDKALADAFGKAYSGAIEPKSAPDHIFTDMIGRTFELIVLLDEHLAEEKDMQSEKIGFLKLIRPQIERSGDFFTGAFTDWNARSFEVRAALANIRETNATIEDSSSISAGDVETKRLKMDTAYIGDVLEEASHLRSQVIMNELFRKFFEAEMVNFERRHDYMMALCGIFDERPNFITANIVQRLVTGMSDTNTEIALLSAQMLAFITERQPEAVGDNEFSELIARMTAPAVTQWHRKDAYGALAVAALARPLRAEEILNIVGAEVRGAIGHKDRSELGFLIYWVYYGLRPDEATPEIVDNMLGGWGKHTYMDALKMIYDKRPDLRQQIVSSIFIKLDSRNWRECENHGYLLARIAESYPDIAPDIRKRLYDTLKGMVIPKEFQGDEPKDNRERELWWQRRARWQEKNQTVDHRRGAVAKIINYSLAFNRDLVDRNIADKIFEIALSDKSSGFIFVGIQSMYEKLVEAAPDMVGVDALDKILKRFEDKLKEEGDVGSFFQKLSEMFSAIVRAKKGSVADDAIKKIKEYLKREPRAGTFEEKQIYYWHAFASEVIGAMTEATAACPTKEIIDRLIELYVKDPFPTSIGQALASIVKVADRPTALKIIDVLKTKIAAGRGGLILPFKDIFAHDVSYITDELVGPILTESLKSFNSVGENATEVLVTVAAQAPYTQGRRVTNEMLRRIESPEQGNFQAREQAIKFLKSVVLFGNMPKLEKTADFIHDRSAGFGLEPSDAPSGLMFLYALAESKDKDFLRLVIKVLDRDRQYDSVRDFVHMGCAFYQQGKFAEFISRVSKEREDSATGELKTAREVVQEMRIEAAQEVRGFEGRILSGWDGVEEFLEQAINNPELAELLIAKIVITMRYLRQGIGDDAG